MRRALIQSESSFHGGEGVGGKKKRGKKNVSTIRPFAHGGGGKKKRMSIVC